MSNSQNYSYKNLMAITFPIMGSQVAVSLVTATDILFIASLGTVAELGAIAIITTFYLTLFSMLKGIAKGVEIIMSRRNGEENYAQIGVSFQYLLLIELLGSFFFLGVIYFLGESLLGLFITDASILEAGGVYLFYRSFGLLFGALSEGLLAFYISVKRTKIMFFYTLITVGTNFVFNYLLILGKGGFPSMGLKGAAIASSLAAVAGFFLILAFMLWEKQSLKAYHLFDWQLNRSNPAVVRSIWRCAAPLVVQGALGYGFYFLFFSFIENLGAQAAALATIGSFMADIAFIPGRSFSVTSTTTVSNAIGEGKPRVYIWGLMHRIMRLSVACTLCVIVLAFAFRFSLMDLFTQTELSYMTTLPVVLVALLGSLLASFSVVYYRALVGTGATHLSMSSVMFSTFFCHLLIASTLVQLFDQVAIIWMAEVLYWVCLGGFAIYFLKKQKGVVAV